MFQKVSDVDAGFELLPYEEEVQGQVTEYREVVENNPAYLYCDTNAVPPPELTWYREGQPLSAADGISVLQGRPDLQGACNVSSGGMCDDSRPSLTFANRG